MNVGEAPEPRGGTPALGGDPAAVGATAPPAWSVTRLPQITKDWEPRTLGKLLIGVDSLDVGLYVTWGKDWPFLLRKLEELKFAAAGTEGIPWDILPDIDCLALPAGKPPNYRFGLLLPAGRFYISKSGCPTNRPNVYASLTSESLWNLGLEPSIASFRMFVEGLGGKIQTIKPSRCDICSDFQLDGPLSLNFLRLHRVSYAEDTSQNEKNNVLGTFYVGAKHSPLQLRIYDKAKEIGTTGKKEWFKKLWGLEAPQNVWRVEFQIRREVLKQFDCHCIEDLPQRLKWLWFYATETWCSFRNADDSNVTRRSVCSWWLQVQEAGYDLPDSVKAVRTRSTGQAGADYFLDRLGGALTRYAALSGCRNLDDAIDMARNNLLALPVGREFTERVKIAALKLMADYGPAPQPGDAYPADWGDI